MAGKASSSDRTTRTSISLPEDLKREMEATEVNWSAYLREAITERLKWEAERNVAEAVLLNEKLRRRAPKGWDSAKAIREWRSRRS